MDRRVYNGCMSNDLKEYYKKQSALEARLKKKDPGAWVTHHPDGDFHSVATWRVKNDGNLIYVQLAEHKSKTRAILDAIKAVEKYLEEKKGATP